MPGSNDVLYYRHIPGCLEGDGVAAVDCLGSWALKAVGWAGPCAAAAPAAALAAPAAAPAGPACAAELLSTPPYIIIIHPVLRLSITTSKRTYDDLPIICLGPPAVGICIVATKQKQEIIQV